MQTHPLHYYEHATDVTNSAFYSNHMCGRHTANFLKITNVYITGSFCVMCNWQLHIAQIKTTLIDCLLVQSFRS